MQAAQGTRRPPGALAETAHERGDEQRAHDRGVDRDRERGAEAELLDEEDVGGDERADRHAEEQRGGGHEAPGALEAVRDRLAGWQPAVVGLLDAGEQEHAVVGGEREGDDEQQHEVGLLEAADRAEAEQRGEVAILEDQHEQARADGDRQQVHRERHERQHERAGHQEQEAAGDEREDRERQRRVRGDRSLLVDEPRGGAADERVSDPLGRRTQPARADCARALVGARADGAARHHFDIPGVAPEVRAAAPREVWPGRLPPPARARTSAHRAGPAGGPIATARVHDRDRLRSR